MTEERAVGDGERRVLEVRARTVDEAVARGLVRLGGVSRSEVSIEVLSEGRSGLLGFGSEEAVVRLALLTPGERADARPGPRAVPERGVSPPSPPRPPESAPPPPAVAPAVSPPPGVSAAPPVVVLDVLPPPSGPAPAPGPASRADVAAAAAVATEVTLELVRRMGFEDAVVERSDALLPSDVDDSPSLVLSLSGRGTEKLLAHDGEALNALQFLVRLIVSRRLNSWVSVLLDVGGSRARRAHELLQMANQSAQLVEREGRPVALPPMSAYDRRVVHLVLKDHPTVITQSIGSGEHRKVTVRMRDQLLPEV
jgi:spoIIIJ-associated protein